MKGALGSLPRRPFFCVRRPGFRAAHTDLWRFGRRASMLRSTRWVTAGRASERIDPVAKKLLIVDDQVGLVKSMRFAAERAGWAVRFLFGGAAAVQTFLEFAPDVVVLDLIMPGKDGIGVLHEILLTGVPAGIVLTTGFGEAYARLAVGVGIFHSSERISVLAKPFRQADFLASLESARGQPGEVAA